MHTTTWVTSSGCRMGSSWRISGRCGNKRKSWYLTSTRAWTRAGTPWPSVSPSKWRAVCCPTRWGGWSSSGNNANPRSWRWSAPWGPSARRSKRRNCISRGKSISPNTHSWKAECRSHTKTWNSQKQSENSHSGTSPGYDKRNPS